MANIIDIVYINSKIDSKLSKGKKKKIVKVFFSRWRKLLLLSFRYNFLYFRVTPRPLYHKGKEEKIKRFFAKNNISTT